LLISCICLKRPTGPSGTTCPAVCPRSCMALWARAVLLHLPGLQGFVTMMAVWLSRRLTFWKFEMFNVLHRQQAPSPKFWVVGTSIWEGIQVVNPFNSRILMLTHFAPSWQLGFQKWVNSHWPIR
jgi:hypothetical protein